MKTITTLIVLNQLKNAFKRSVKVVEILKIIKINLVKDLMSITHNHLLIPTMVTDKVNKMIILLTKQTMELELYLDLFLQILIEIFTIMTTKISKSDK